MDRLSFDNNQKRLFKKIDLYDILQHIELAKSKKTIRSTLDWLASMETGIKELFVDEREMTLFEKIRKQNNIQTNKKKTLFDNIRDRSSKKSKRGKI